MIISTSADDRVNIRRQYYRSNNSNLTNGIVNLRNIHAFGDLIKMKTLL